VGDTFGLDIDIHLTQPVHVEDVVGAEGAIDEEFAFPMSVGFLQAEQIFLRARDGVGQGGKSRERGEFR
jgi:hypothetical protein